MHKQDTPYRLTVTDWVNGLAAIPKSMDAGAPERPAPQPEKLDGIDHWSLTSMLQWLLKTGRRLMHRQETAYHLTVTDWVNGLAAIPESMDAVPPEHPAPQPGKITEATDFLHRFEPETKTQLPDRTPAVSPTLVLSDSVPITPEARVTSSLVQKDGDRVLRDLRSALFQSEPATGPKRENEIILDSNSLLTGSAIASGLLWSRSFSSDHTRTASPTVVSSDSAPIAPQAPASGALTQVDGDSVMRDLRSALSKSNAARRARRENEIIPERPAVEWQRLRKWISAAVLILVEALVLCVGTWYYTSQDWNIGAAFERVKAMAASVFSESATSPPPPAIAHPSIARVGPRPHKGSKSQGSKQASSGVNAEVGTGNKTPAISQFEVLDAQNGRRLLPRTPVPFERLATSESNNASGDEPGLTAPASAEPTSAEPTSAEPTSAPPPNAPGSELGHVSQLSSEELPTVQVLPEYPALALRNNVQGRVVLRAVISKDGSLQNVRLVGPPSLLDSPSLNAVRKWQYQPHYENGEPVEVETQITLEFSITAK